MINNHNEAKINKVYSLLFFAPSAVFFVYAFLDFPSINYVYILLTLISLSGFLWFRLQRPYSVFFEKDDKVFIFRYFYSGIIKFKNTEIIIPREELYGYDILISFFGRRKALILKIQKGTQVSKYKPIYVSMFTTKDLNQLKSILDQQISNNWE